MKDVGWGSKEKMASYTEHVNEAKKYKSATKYYNANKDTKFYKSVPGIKHRWPERDIMKDAGWDRNKGGRPKQ
jgi:hypothetical protein